MEKFDEGWRTWLLEFEFGDLISTGSEMILLAEENGMLKGWDIDQRSTVEMASIIDKWAANLIGLYRPRQVNPLGGPTSSFSMFSGEGQTFLGEDLNPVLDLYNGSRDYVWIKGNVDLPKSVTLPLHWYMGMEKHVVVSGGPVRVSLGLEDVFGVGVLLWGLKKTGTKALGGGAGIIALVVDIASWIEWDSSYSIQPGQGTLPQNPVPVPTPPKNY